jgi:hypothetical protein
VGRVSTYWQVVQSGGHTVYPANTCVIYCARVETKILVFVFSRKFLFAFRAKIIQKYTKITKIFAKTKIEAKIFTQTKIEAKIFTQTKIEAKIFAKTKIEAKIFAKTKISTNTYAKITLYCAP